MPLSPLTVTSVIAQMDPQDFQVFCLWFLQDSGYDASPGPLKGPDAGFDIAGLHLGSRFVAHCTTHGGPSAKVREKFARDVMRAAGTGAAAGEIVLCSVKSIGNLTVEKEFIQALQAKLGTYYPAYAMAKPTITVFDGERLGLATSQMT